MKLDETTFEQYENTLTDGQQLINDMLYDMEAHLGDKDSRAGKLDKLIEDLKEMADRDQSMANDLHPTIELLETLSAEIYDCGCLQDFQLMDINDHFEMEMDDAN